MKKKSGSRIGRVLKGIVNIRSWSDWDRMKSFTVYLSTGFKRFFVPQKNQKEESFNAAIERLKLSDDELLVKQNSLLRLSIVMLVAAILILLYTGYQLLYGSYIAALTSFIVMLIALALAFRYHFWFYQMKRRKLGCTIKEWYRHGLLKEKE